jgi:hypothetical protein
MGDLSPSMRTKRGFHRIGVGLAAVLGVCTFAIGAFISTHEVNSQQSRSLALRCAFDQMASLLSPRAGPPLTLNIEGRKVQVDDSFLKLSPEQQNATVDEIAKSLGRSKQAADFADRVALLAEAHRRGILPPDPKAAYEEAQKRGFIKPLAPGVSEWPGKRVGAREFAARTIPCIAVRRREIDRRPSNTGRIRAVGRIPATR